MSLVPLDLARYRDWTIQQLYYMLFPYIKEDFMGRSDCENVHRTGNMTVTTSDGVINVTHIIQGGSDTMLTAKQAEYEAYVAEGRVTVETAQQTGTFTGVAR